MRLEYEPKSCAIYGNYLFPNPLNDVFSQRAKLLTRVHWKVKMDIQRCFEILEIKSDASPEEAKRAYKDIVSVWHPDRFSNNPRLEQKAGEKLKEVNAAYEKVKSLFSGRQEGGSEQKPTAQEEAKDYKAQARPEARDKTEVLVEVGTRTLLAACSYLYKTLHHIFVSQASETKPQAQAEPGRASQARCQSRGSGKGRGRGGRGGGRGRGVGGCR
jgi:curved DNA-binding protein CbpA